MQGLAALLVQGLSGSTAAQIVAIPPDFINTLGLQQSLTPSRNNGFLNMFRLMQRKSLELVQREQRTADEVQPLTTSVCINFLECFAVNHLALPYSAKVLDASHCSVCVGHNHRCKQTAVDVLLISN